jgi:hypothetical protein
MSIFRTYELNCPACNTPVRFDLVMSVSADRRPDLREAILDGSFQRKVCPACATAFRPEPEFTYIDFARGQYIFVYPVDKRPAWQEWEAKAAAIFDSTLGKNATKEAVALGKKVDPRVVFGWPALIEKILARQAGIDDRTLEVAKILVMQNSDESPVPGQMELRLVGDEDGDLVFAWVHALDRTVGDAMRVPRSLIAEIETQPTAWKGVRDDVSEGLVVDFQRAMLTA